LLDTPKGVETGVELSAQPSYCKDSLLLDIGQIMLAKMTSKNQLTLPKSVTNALGDVEYFDVQTKDGQVILTPVRIQRADAVRAKLAALDLNEQDIADAVTWARQSTAKRKK